ncbi:hypothetical protein BJ165DRAFT_1490091 [Panaeolus papilionaceus]|nr:hypothetical protein BJ165DRAFT_1490091 [Panaeolus papilionaceus]
MSSSGFLNQTFNNRDTGNLRYQGFWFLEGSWNATSVGLSGTLASSNDPNANVTFTFPVPALAFYYYGMKRSGGGLYEICIDCDPRNEIWLPIDALNVTDNGQNPPVVLFSQTFKAPGIHEIIIRNSNDTRVHPGGNSQITLERIDIEVVNSNAPPPTTSAPPPSTTLPPSGILGNNPLSDSAKANKVPIGSIIGGILGAIVLTSLLFLFGYWYMRSRKRAARARANLEAPPTPGHVHSDQLSPSVMSQVSNATHQHNPSNSSDRPFGLVIPPRKAGLVSATWVETPTTSNLHSRPSMSSSSVISSSLYTDASSPTTVGHGGRRPRREMDGGPLPLSLEEEDEEDDRVLPPEYGQVFGRSRRNTRSARDTLASPSPPSEPPPPDTKV